MPPFWYAIGIWGVTITVFSGLMAQWRATRGYNCGEWGMHLTPDHPISCGLPLRQPAHVENYLAEVVGPTAEAHCASWRDERG